jgi:hypothetical protein
MFGSNGATLATGAFARRLMPTSTPLVAFGATSEVSICNATGEPAAMPAASTWKAISFWPALLVTKPERSTPKAPAREYTWLPLSLSTKNPPPEMARSKLLLVDLMLPWSNCWVMAAVRTPRLTASDDTPRFEPV